MKNLILAVTLFLMVGSAGAVIPPNSIAKPAKQTIKESIAYPQFAIEQGIEGRVWIRVQVKADGNVEVISASSTNNELLRYTVDKVEDMVLAGDLDAVDQPFNLKFDFILL